MVGNPLHWQQDERCGYCYELWPCDAADSPTSIRPSGIHKWRMQESHKKFERERKMLQDKGNRCNELLDQLGYPMWKWVPGAIGQKISLDMMLDLLERLYKYEQPSTNEMGGPSDVRGRPGV